jgi:hypothetical protein
MKKITKYEVLYRNDDVCIITIYDKRNWYCFEYTIGEVNKNKEQVFYFYPKDNYQLDKDYPLFYFKDFPISDGWRVLYIQSDKHTKTITFLKKEFMP